MMVKVEIAVRKNTANCQRRTKNLGFTYPQLDSSRGKKQVQGKAGRCVWTSST